MVWVHQECNTNQTADDEKIGQLLSVRHGPPPTKERLRFTIGSVKTADGDDIAAVTVGVDWKRIIRRWICACHAALYSEYLPLDVKMKLHLPWPEAVAGPDEHLTFRPIPDDHRKLVQAIKVNRPLGRTDKILGWNQKFIFECLWDRADNGPWLCIFTIDLYRWKELACDIPTVPLRGCVGCYWSDARPPDGASIGTSIQLPWLRSEDTDAFG
jgi:hypothetical protein